MITLDTEGLPEELYPVSWLIGEWEGTGLLGGNHDLTNERFMQTAGFTVTEATDETPASLQYTTELRLADMDDDGNITAGADVLLSETGVWKIAKERPDALTDPQEFPLDVTITTSWGDEKTWTTQYVGIIGRGKIELLSEKIDIHNPKNRLANDIWRSKRMLGWVNNRLLWAWDIAILGTELESMASGGLWRPLESL